MSFLSLSLFESELDKDLDRMWSAIVTDYIIYFKVDSIGVLI